MYVTKGQAIFHGLGLENAHAYLADVKVDELSFLVRHVAAKLPAHKHVPTANTTHQLTHS